MRFCVMFSWIGFLGLSFGLWKAGAISPDQVADLYLPSNVAAPFPTVVLVHGGFWQAPYKRDLMEPTARDLCRLTTPNPSPCPSPSPNPSPRPSPSPSPTPNQVCDCLPEGGAEQAALLASYPKP